MESETIGGLIKRARARYRKFRTEICVKSIVPEPFGLLSNITSTNREVKQLRKRFA